MEDALAATTAERTLGWYNLAGTAYITAEAAENPAALLEILNHEGTHHILAATTPFGYVQQLLQPHESVWEELPARLVELSALLREASLFAHEAAATASGLAFRTGDDLADRRARLPPLYRAGYDLFQSLFLGRELSAVDRLRLPRTIGARAFQTTLLADWFREGLHEPGRLKEYLADPAHRPNDRLRAIVEALRSRTDAEMRAWAGAFAQTGESFALFPPTPSPLVDIPFRALPGAEGAYVFGDALLTRLAPDMTPDEREQEITWTLNVSKKVAFAIVPDPHGYTLWPDGQLDDAWCAEVDFIQVDPNTHDELPITNPKDASVTIPPRHARLYFHRPDYTMAGGTMAPLASLTRMLEGSPPLRDATVCVGFPPFLPEPAYLSASDPIAPWLRDRRTLFLVTGDMTVLLGFLTILEKRDVRERFVYHASLPDPNATWGFILIRQEDSPTRMTVFATLVNEWNDWLEPLSALVEMRWEPDPRAFFADRAFLRDFIRLQRIWLKQQLGLREWRALLKAAEGQLLGSAITYPKPAVNRASLPRHADDEGQP